MKDLNDWFSVGEKVGVSLVHIHLHELSVRGFEDRQGQLCIPQLHISVPHRAMLAQIMCRRNVCVTHQSLLVYAFISS